MDRVFSSQLKRKPAGFYSQAAASLCKMPTTYSLMNIVTVVPLVTTELISNTNLFNPETDTYLYKRHLPLQTGLDMKPSHRQ